MRKLLTVLCVMGCASPVPPGDKVSSDKQRVTSAAPSADLKAAIAGNADFAFDLYRELAKSSEGNLFLSPQSISMALTMTYAGAKGETAKSLERVMHISLPADRQHRAMNDLDRQLESRGQGASGADGKPFRLQQANQLFAQKNYTLEAPFLDTLAQEYGADGRLLDFAGSPDPSRLAINDWVEGKTESRIKTLLKEGTITSDTRLVLVNAIYFNAAWSTQFEKSMTTDGVFHTPEADITAKLMRVPLVRATATSVAGTEIFALPYQGKELSMLVLMPPAGQLAALEKSLTAATLDGYVAALQEEDLTVVLPKFTIEGESLSLNAPLRSLGLTHVFEDADFSGITAQDALTVDNVVHKTFVKLDENGTEAAAATAVTLTRNSAPQTRTVTVDRPFLFLIRDNATGAIVFLGKLSSPKI